MQYAHKLFDISLAFWPGQKTGFLVVAKMPNNCLVTKNTPFVTQNHYMSICEIT